jgi:hypothetical protein
MDEKVDSAETAVMGGASSPFGLFGALGDLTTKSMATGRSEFGVGRLELEGGIIFIFAG